MRNASELNWQVPSKRLNCRWFKVMDKGQLDRNTSHQSKIQEHLFSDDLEQRFPTFLVKYTIVLTLKALTNDSNVTDKEKIIICLNCSQSINMQTVKGVTVK